MLVAKCAPYTIHISYHFPQYIMFVHGLHEELTQSCNIVTQNHDIATTRFYFVEINILNQV